MANISLIIEVSAYIILIKHGWKAVYIHCVTDYSIQCYADAIVTLNVFIHVCSPLYMNTLINMCLHIIHMQSLRGTGYATLLLTRRLAHVADRPGN